MTRLKILHSVKKYACLHGPISTQASTEISKRITANTERNSLSSGTEEADGRNVNGRLIGEERVHDAIDNVLRLKHWTKQVGR